MVWVLQEVSKSPVDVGMVSTYCLLGQLKKELVKMFGIVWTEKENIPGAAVEGSSQAGALATAGEDIMEFDLASWSWRSW